MINLTQSKIMQNWGTDNAETPLVSVHCITYNHEPYIAQALDGFLMQKTNFPFEVIVHDDASTDRTAEIIREYEVRFPKIIKPIYETENQYSKHDGSVERIIAACKGKYIAYCDGDDYWIDENKLQMQADFLEGNPEYGMCYGMAKEYNESQKKFGSAFGKDAKDFETFLEGNPVPNCTSCYKRSVYEQYLKEIKPESKGWLMGDYPMLLYFYCKSKMHFFSNVMAVYRILLVSASHSQDPVKIKNFNISVLDIRMFFLNYAGLKSEKQLDFAIYAFTNGEKKKGIEYLSNLHITDIKGKKRKLKYLVLKNNFLRTLYILKRNLNKM